MSIHFDEKGKFFTNVVNKEAIQVIIQTTTNVVRGKIHIMPGHRLKDEINQLDEFLAVTEATVYNPSGKEMYHCEFIAINREMIVWLLPESDLYPQVGGGDV
jgi:hypothetical protein